MAADERFIDNVGDHHAPRRCQQQRDGKILRRVNQYLDPAHEAHHQHGQNRRLQCHDERVDEIAVEESVIEEALIPGMTRPPRR
jgi:hypothetical protein